MQEYSQRFAREYPPELRQEPGLTESTEILHATETKISSDLMGHLVHIQTFTPTLTSTQNASKQGKQIVISLLFSQG